ncbi:MAG TPA: hypothetical protein VG826_33915 [Pirellulales bacterium]|nr:hypothetical protein [Pirellulales bacterium]
MKYAAGPIFHQAQYDVRLPADGLTERNVVLLAQVPNLRGLELTASSDGPGLDALKLRLPGCRIRLASRSPPSKTKGIAARQASVVR